MVPPASLSSPMRDASPLDSPSQSVEHSTAGISREHAQMNGELESDDNDMGRFYTPGRSKSRSRSPRSTTRSRSRDGRNFRHTTSPSDQQRTHHLDSPRPERPNELRYKLVYALRGHKKAISAVKFSPDGTKIASCSADGAIKVWDAKTGKHEHTFEGHLAGTSIIAWSPDSRLIASGGDDKTIRLWDVAKGKAQPVPLLGHDNYVYSLAFSPKGNMVVSGSYDEAVFLWDIRAARVMRKLPAHSDPVSGVDFVHDGTLIVSCSSDGLIRIWDTGTGQCLRTIIHEDHAPVVGVRFSPNGKYVLAWTLDSALRLWNYVDGRCVKTYQGHTNSRFSLGGAFGTYGPIRHPFAFVASGSEDGSIWLWDVSSKAVLQRLDNAHDGAVFGVDTHPSERSIVSGGADGLVRVWGCDEYVASSETETTLLNGDVDIKMED